MQGHWSYCSTRGRSGSLAASKVTAVAAAAAAAGDAATSAELCVELIEICLVVYEYDGVCIRV